MLQHIGREQLYTHQPEITSENVLDVISKAMTKFRQNADDCQFLLNYEKGDQPLIRKVPKMFMKDIDVQAVDGIPAEITDFWVAFAWSSPISLIQRGDGEANKAEAIKELNNQYASTGHVRDMQKLARFVEICGIGYTLIEINKEWEEGEAYFTRDVLDPRNAFVVRSSYYTDKRVMLGVTFSFDENGNIYMTAYSKDIMFIIKGNKITNGARRKKNFMDGFTWEEDERSGEANPLGRVPIIEWVRSEDRTGVFEKQISAIDNLNLILSDISNGIEQNVSCIWLATDIELPEEEVKDEDGNVVQQEQTIRDGQWLMTYTSKDGKTPDVKPLKLDYGINEMRENYLAQRDLILQKCHVPQRNDNSGGSTGVATDSAAGWADSESQAQAQECITIGCQLDELKVVLSAIRESPDVKDDNVMLDLMVSDIQPAIRRPRNFDITSKTNAIATLLSHGFALEDCVGNIPLFQDATQVIARSGEGVRKYQETIWNTESEAEGGDGENAPNSDRLQADMSDQVENSPLLAME